MSRIVAASSKSTWIALAIAMAIQTGLISIQARRRINTGFVRVWILDTLAPMEKLVDRSTYAFRYVWDGYIGLIGVHNENQRLRHQVDELQMQLQKNHEDVLELQRLRALLSFPVSNLGKTIVARVIGRDPARNQTVTIDKGAAHGVRPDAAVITPAGAVGRVIQTSNFFSIVQLIIDSQSAVGVLLESTRRQGVVRGTGGGDLDLDYIDDDNDLKQGDVFLTSGLDRIYPKGLPVGVITSIGPRRGLLKTVQIRPSADLGHLEEVICVIQQAQEIQGQTPNSLDLGNSGSVPEFPQGVSNR
jgi:rod shape-determining protein MreC